MTREEAIDVLSDFRKFTLSILGKSIYAERCSALDMAIEALSADAVGYETTATINEPISIQSNYVYVVRCKDCIHWQKTNIETIDGEPTYDCPFCGEWADANGFCSFGERREE
mgnify:CR=1 FL=1